MKLELERQNFLKAWQIAEKVAQTKTTKDAISGILVTASDFEITLEATDLKTSVKCKAVGANVLEPGSAVIPASIFGSMLKKSPSEDLVLEVNSSRGILKAGRNKTRFAVIPTEEFPQIPESENAEELCTLLADDLSRIIAEGTIAASQPQDFPRYMGTCLLKTDEGYLRAVSTDGKRLSISKVICTNVAKEQEALITASALKDLGKTLASSYSEKDVKILVDASTVWFKLEDVEFSIRKVDASFPTYMRILNQEIYSTLRVKTTDLIPMLERIDIIARTNPAHIMAMSITSGTGEVRVIARSPEHGTVTDVLYADVDRGYLQVGYNLTFFQDGLKAIGPGEARIEFSSEEGQTRMYRGDSDEFLYMLMPARLSAQDRLTEEEIVDFSNRTEEPQPLPEQAPEENHEEPHNENNNQEQGQQQQEEQNTDAPF